MRRTKVLPSLAVTAIVIMGVLTAASPASATAAGIASAGSATVVRNGHSLPIAPLGPCSLTGQRHGKSNGATRNGIVTFGPATSTCTANAQAHTSSSVADGSDFTLSALQNYGGPTIKIASYQVTCTATQTGTNAGWQFSGLTGITVPQQIPNNFHVAVTSSTGTLLATIVLNEIILPDPNDGSITQNLMHIILFPNGTPPGATALSGDIYVGQTACSPTA
jgi:hypothetical protein